MSKLIMSTDIHPPRNNDFRLFQMIPIDPSYSFLETSAYMQPSFFKPYLPQAPSKFICRRLILYIMTCRHPIKFSLLLSKVFKFSEQSPIIRNRGGWVSCCEFKRVGSNPAIIDLLLSWSQRRETFPCTCCFK